MNNVYVLIRCNLSIWEDYDGTLNEERGIPMVAGVYKTKEKMIKELTDDNGIFRFSEEFAEQLVETGNAEDYNDCYYLYKKELN